MQRHSKAVDIVDDFAISFDRAKQIMEFINSEMVKGLNVCADQKHGGSSMLMLPTFVTARPSGNENGVFIGIDLGGSNCRVLVCHLDQGHFMQSEVSKFVVPEKVMNGAVDSCVFEFLVDCLENVFSLSLLLSNFTSKIFLGLTFSFAVEQTALAAGILVLCGKDWSLPSVMGKDVMQLFRQALEKRTSISSRVHAIALLNDTTGTCVRAMFNSATTSNPTVAAVIIGTGTNMCCWEEIKGNKLEKLGVSGRHQSVMLMGGC